MAMNEFTRLCVDTANNRVQAYTANDANTAIRKAFFDAMHLDSENFSRKDLHRAIRRYKADIYDLVEETLEVLLGKGWGENPFFRQFVEEKNIGAGDENIFYVEDNTMLTVSKFSGNHHDLIRQKLGSGESYTVPMSWYGLKIYSNFEQMMLGHIDWSTFVQKIYEAMDKKVNDMIYTAFMDVDAVLPTDNIVTGDPTREEIIELCQKVSGITGKEVVIVGTKVALSKLYTKMDATWVSNEMKNERNTLGMPSVVEGIRTMEIPQVYEIGTRDALIDNTKLLVIPVDSSFKPVKLVHGGEAYFNEVTDRETNVDMTIEAEYMHKMGVSVVVTMEYGMIKMVA